MRNVEFKSKPPRVRGRSSTLDILGTFPGNRAVRGRWAEHHRLLTTLRDEFAGAKSELSVAARAEPGGLTEHIADVATDSYDRDWALASLSSAQGVLYEIDQALNRIENGTYGVCELTGNPIEPARLKAVPWTRFSAEAQAQLEARGATNRVHLGAVRNFVESSDSDDEEVGDQPAGDSRHTED